MEAVPNGSPHPDFYQHLVVMRHGDRFDNFDRSWSATAPRPFDPPLHNDGLARAFDTGRTFLNLLPFSFHRLFVSPFLRCVQTAAQVLLALSAANPSTTLKVCQFSLYIRSWLLLLLCSQSSEVYINFLDFCFRNFDGWILVWNFFVHSGIDRNWLIMMFLQNANIQTEICK